MESSSSSSWTTLSTLYTIGGSASYNPYLSGVAVGAKGDLFVAGGSASAPWTVWELPQGSSTPMIIDTSSGKVSALAVDPAGNVYAAGHLLPSVRNVPQDQWAIRRGTFNSTTGSWTFSTVDHLATESDANGVGIVTTTVGGMPATAAYVVGQVGPSWVVRKSVNGGPWSQVESFRYDLTGRASSAADGIAADAFGNLYVAGSGSNATITGYNENKTPIYSYTSHWLVRKSTNGGASWSTNDDSYLGPDSGADAICFDPQTGAMEVGGSVGNITGICQAIVRSNARPRRGRRP